MILRYSWSDRSGRQYLTKETVKTPTIHWQWVRILNLFDNLLRFVYLKMLTLLLGMFVLGQRCSFHQHCVSWAAKTFQFFLLVLSTIYWDLLYIFVMNVTQFFDQVSDWMVDYHTPGGVDKDGWQVIGRFFCIIVKVPKIGLHSRTSFIFLIYL